LKVLKEFSQKLQNRVNELEIDVTHVRRESRVLQKEVGTINNKATISKNIFGVILKKTDGSGLHIKQAKEETKQIQKNALDFIFKDKVEELKGLRANILSMSPKTVSSRSDIEDIPVLDFTDENSFKIAEEKLLQKEKAYQEKQQEKKAKEKGMTVDV